MKYFVLGLTIGILSFIPGISSGTILYLSHEYDNFTYYLTHLKTNYLKIISLLIGAFLGIITFSKVINFLFLNFPNGTKVFFAYLVLFSLPPFLKKEHLQFKIIPFLISLIVLFSLNFFLPSIPINSNITLTIPFLLFFSFSGFLDGFITIIPGISGSMIMMILGPYYLYKTISANVTNNIIYLIPLFFYFLSDFIGIYLGSKFTNLIINKYKLTSNSFIFGFIIASLLIIIPFKSIFTLPSLILLLTAYIISTLLNS